MAEALSCVALGYGLAVLVVVAYIEWDRRRHRRGDCPQCVESCEGKP